VEAGRAQTIRQVTSSIRLRRLRKHTVLYLIAIPILLLMVLPYFYMLMHR